MGGGGGYFDLSTEQLKKLEERAKDTLRKADAPERRNVFISFAVEDLAVVTMLRGQAKNDNVPIEFNDWSLSKPFDSADAAYIKRGIRERIRQSSVTLVYVSDASARSKWVDWEIRESIKLGKGVVGVYSGDAPPKKLPPAMTTGRVPVVRWAAADLTAAIERAARIAK